jgi:nicotinamide-nucleotide amidase
MFSSALLAQAERLLADARAKGLKIVTAESCTGGLITGLLTEIPGSSDVVERGFVTYSNEAKVDQLGVTDEMISELGAVSEPVARAMSQGALLCSRADLSVAVTGIAGPGGGSVAKPVGLVFISAARAGQPITVVSKECRFGDIGRGEVRLRTVAVALELLATLLQSP